MDTDDKFDAQSIQIDEVKNNYTKYYVSNMPTSIIT